jgi:hypothetical protein
LINVLDIPLVEFAEEFQERDFTVFLTSSDLEFPRDVVNDVEQFVGLRFNTLAIPRNSEIISAYIQLTAIEPQTGPTTVRFRAEANMNPAIFTTDSGSISSRVRTNSYVDWSPSDWSLANESDEAQQTVDLGPLIEELIWQDDWVPGLDIVIVASRSPQDTGLNMRNAYSGRDGAHVPVLHIVFKVNTGE